MAALTLADAIAAADRRMVYEDFIDDYFEDDPEIVAKVSDLNAKFCRSARHTWASDPSYVSDMLDNPGNHLTREDLILQQAGHRAAYSKAERTRRLEALAGTDHEAWPDREYQLFWRNGSRWLRLAPVDTDAAPAPDPERPTIVQYVRATVERARQPKDRPILLSALYTTIADSYARTYGVRPSRRDMSNALDLAPRCSRSRRAAGIHLVIWGTERDR
ncbi:hypothetical protein [Curtobacterium flaccumfaciens]|uniref:hypothetical protein n=1 Tax=Curtobacterium flaccumfaciens TaxID=2035 RepID=UPI0038797A6E